jgi:hypothetical protein
MFRCCESLFLKKERIFCESLRNRKLDRRASQYVYNSCFLSMMHGRKANTDTLIRVSINWRFVHAGLKSICGEQNTSVGVGH